jgi:hypothetical protein
VEALATPRDGLGSLFHVERNVDSKGANFTDSSPDLIGKSEVENSMVLEISLHDYVLC